jgi:hypothetical protein
MASPFHWVWHIEADVIDIALLWFRKARTLRHGQQINQVSAAAHLAEAGVLDDPLDL